MTALTVGLAIFASAANKTELTVYNQGYALVKEQRTLDLQAGVHEITIEDVAQQIEANSVGVRSLTDRTAFSVLEQSYRFDLVSVQAILARAVGQTLHFNQLLANGQHERITGTLLSAPNAILSDANGNQNQVYNGMVVKADDGRILLNPSGTVEVDSIPAGLISKPSLVWLLDSNRSGSHDIQLSYLSRGFAWKSDYVLALNEAGTVGDLKGWVTMTNNSGTSFADANLKLLAGEVNRVQQPVDVGIPTGSVRRATKFKRDMVEEQFGDYHLYTLDRPATIRNNEVKQLSLLESTGVQVSKQLLIDSGISEMYSEPDNDGATVENIKPVIYILIENRKDNHLGMPLPAGTFKVFQRSKSGSLEMLGEDNITHTPRDEKLKLKVGNAFDVVANRRRVNYSKLSSTRVRETYEVEVRNRKEAPETVTVWERNSGDHKITSSNMDYTVLDSTTTQFEIHLAANEVKTVRYTIETKLG